MSNDILRPAPAAATYKLRAVLSKVLTCAPCKLCNVLCKVLTWAHCILCSVQLAKCSWCSPVHLAKYTECYCGPPPYTCTHCAHCVLTVCLLSVCSHAHKLAQLCSPSRSIVLIYSLCSNSWESDSQVHLGGFEKVGWGHWLTGY